MKHTAVASAVLFVLSPNYKNRASDIKWLARPEDQNPRETGALIPTKAMIGENVRFAFSGQYESGFGCGLVAKAQSYKAFPKIDVPATAVKLHFNGSWFVRDEDRFKSGSYSDRVRGADRVYFAADGGVYATGIRQ